MLKLSIAILIIFYNFSQMVVATRAGAATTTTATTTFLSVLTKWRVIPNYGGNTRLNWNSTQPGTIIYKGTGTGTVGSHRGGTGIGALTTTTETTSLLSVLTKWSIIPDPGMNTSLMPNNSQSGTIISSGTSQHESSETGKSVSQLTKPPKASTQQSHSLPPVLTELTTTLSGSPTVVPCLTGGAFKTDKCIFATSTPSSSGPQPTLVISGIRSSLLKGFPLIKDWIKKKESHQRDDIGPILAWTKQIEHDVEGFLSGLKPPPSSCKSSCTCSFPVSLLTCIASDVESLVKGVKDVEDDITDVLSKIKDTILPHLEKLTDKLKPDKEHNTPSTSQTPSSSSVCSSSVVEDLDVSCYPLTMTDGSTYRTSQTCLRSTITHTGCGLSAFTTTTTLPCESPTITRCTTSPVMLGSTTLSLSSDCSTITTCGPMPNSSSSSIPGSVPPAGIPYFDRTEAESNDTYTSLLLMFYHSDMMPLVNATSTSPQNSTTIPTKMSHSSSGTGTTGTTTTAKDSPSSTLNPFFSQIGITTLPSSLNFTPPPSTITISPIATGFPPRGLTCDVNRPLLPDPDLQGFSLCNGGWIIDDFCCAKSHGLVSNTMHLNPVQVYYPLHLQRGVFMSLSNITDPSACDPSSKPPGDPLAQFAHCDPYCVAILKGIMNDCDTTTTTNKKGGIRVVGCDRWSIVAMSESDGKNYPQYTGDHTNEDNCKA